MDSNFGTSRRASFRLGAVRVVVRALLVNVLFLDSALARENGAADVHVLSSLSLCSSGESEPASAGNGGILGAIVFSVVPQVSDRLELIPALNRDIRSFEGDRVLGASKDPGTTHVVRIRDKDAEHWSFGFETPVTGRTFIDLRPDTGYELQGAGESAGGEGAPTCLAIRTDPAGGATNIVPFPQR